VTKETAELPSKRLPEFVIKDEEVAGAAKEADEAVTGEPQKIIDKNEEVKAKAKAREVQKMIENRLDFLARMYAANKEGEGEEKEEGDEKKE
jgi:hypothetical protein